MCLRAEFALSTVATVTGVDMKHCAEEFLHAGVGARVGICDHIVQEVHHLGGSGGMPPLPPPPPPGNFCILDLFESI